MSLSSSSDCKYDVITVSLGTYSSLSETKWCGQTTVSQITCCMHLVTTAACATCFRLEDHRRQTRCLCFTLISVKTPAFVLCLQPEVTGADMYLRWHLKILAGDKSSSGSIVRWQTAEQWKGGGGYILHSDSRATRVVSSLRNRKITQIMILLACLLAYF